MTQFVMKKAEIRDKSSLRILKTCVRLKFIIHLI